MTRNSKGTPVRVPEIPLMGGVILVKNCTEKTIITQLVSLYSKWQVHGLNSFYLWHFFRIGLSVAITASCFSYVTIKCFSFVQGYFWMNQNGFTASEAVPLIRIQSQIFMGSFMGALGFIYYFLCKKNLAERFLVIVVAVIYSAVLVSCFWGMSSIDSTDWGDPLNNVRIASVNCLLGLAAMVTGIFISPPESKRVISTFIITLLTVMFVVIPKYLPYEMKSSFWLIVNLYWLYPLFSAIYHKWLFRIFSIYSL